MYLDLLKKSILDLIYGPIVAGNARNVGKIATPEQISDGSFWPMLATSMIGQQRMDNIQECFEDVIKNNIEGDVIETGVWRGGASIFMAGINKFYNQNRKVYVADSFEGLPQPDATKYPKDAGDEHHKIQYLAVSLEQVKRNFAKYDLLDDNVIFIKGFFEDSLKKVNFDKLAILRLDGDMYSSTIQVLDELYDKLVPGGYIIIDDYGVHIPCKTAVSDFRQKHNITTEIKMIDKYGAYWKKE